MESGSLGAGRSARRPAEMPAESCGGSAFIVAVAEDDKNQFRPRPSFNVSGVPARARCAGAISAIYRVDTHLLMTDSIQFTTVSTPDDASGILDLQVRNLSSALTAQTLASQGFVTVRHDESVLRRMDEAAPSIIAKAGGRVVGTRADGRSQRTQR